jgi:hypothetical protein
MLFPLSIHGLPNVCNCTLAERQAFISFRKSAIKNMEMEDDLAKEGSALERQVEDAKYKYIQAAEALCRQVEEAKQAYHHATDVNRQAAQERYITSLNALNSLVAAGGAPKQFEPAPPNGKDDPYKCNNLNG